MKSLISEVTSIRKLTTSAGDELAVLNGVTVIEIMYIPKRKLSINSKY